VQFKSAFKQLIVHADLQDVARGNCLPLEYIPILTVSSNNVNNVTPAISVIKNTSCPIPEDEAIPYSNTDPSHDTNSTLLSTHIEMICAYIAGFVFRKLKNSLHCEQCICALRSTDDSSTIYNLIRAKSKGCLCFPSSDVIKICLQCEKSFRHHVSSDVCSLSNFQLSKLVSIVLKSFIGIDFFPSLTHHMFENSPLENHAVHLVRAVCEKYLQVRYYYAARTYSANLKNKLSKISRQRGNKLIIFSGL
jgi:hypothetical protein